MADVLIQAADIFKAYSDKNIYMTLFFCGILYLWITEEDKGKKMIFIYASGCILFLFFFPLSTYVLIHTVFDQETYYRILWFLPVSIVVAYSAIRIISRQEKKSRKIVLALLACVILAAGGDYTYDNPTYEKAANLYHIPQQVVDICEAIKPNEENTYGWVCAVVPQEMISYVRQYDSTIHLPYGREVLIERWNLWNPMYQTMEADIIYAKTLAKQAREDDCQYIILHQDKVFDEDIQQYNFQLVDNIDGYNIYWDAENPMGVTYIDKTS